MALLALGLLAWAPAVAVAGQQSRHEPTPASRTTCRRGGSRPLPNWTVCSTTKRGSASPSRSTPGCPTTRCAGSASSSTRRCGWPTTSKAIYFAFKCLDPEPDKIRTTISRRDNVWNDDWVGVSLDSSRAGQMAYHMFVNPSGIQMDALQSSNEDAAVDWVWQSAGRVDADGYTVEVRLPLAEHPLPAAATDVRMGVLFFRRSSRHGHVVVVAGDAADGEWVFENHAQLSFGELHQPLSARGDSERHRVAQRHARGGPAVAGVAVARPTSAPASNTASRPR